MLSPFWNEAEIQAGGETLRLVINFRTIDILETLTGKPMDDILAEITSPRPPHALVGKFLWAMLREHHPSVTLDQVGGLVYSPEYADQGVIVGDLIERAFNVGNAAEGKKRPRPPKRQRGASKPS
ncbi:MAG TPA: hypothetical protein VNH53_03765 [Sphingomicrobium sp.]|nr:hypothetical protein [Sphingomicrobium sp.]